MRRLLVGMAVAAACALVGTWAMAGNQEVADQIASTLKDSGQLHGYRVSVKYQDGTVWLKGQVATQEEVSAAMQLASGVPGVTRVVNNLTVGSKQPATGAASSASANQISVQAIDNAPSRLSQTSPATAEKAQPSASQAAPKQAQRLATVLTPVAEEPKRQVTMTGLEEPTVAPAKPAGDAWAATPRTPRPMPMAYAQAPLPIARTGQPVVAPQPAPIPAGPAVAQFNQPNLPNYAWPAYAAYPNYAAVTYPKQYSPTAWPYIGPFYPYPQVPLGWRKVTLEWHDGWWNLDFDDGTAKGPFSGLFRPARRRY